MGPVVERHVPDYMHAEANHVLAGVDMLPEKTKR